MKVTVFGTGLMGSAFVRTLLASGVDVTVWNRSVDKLAPLVELGARAAHTVEEAIAASDALFMVVLDQSIVQDLLADRDLSGKTVVNFTTGTSAQAVVKKALVVGQGGRYVDAVIAAYPDHIGQRSAMLYFAGDEAAYQELAETLAVLAGRIPFVGTAPGNANVLDAAWIGGFHCVAMGGFHEAVSYAMAEGVTIDTMAESVDYYLEFLRVTLEEAVEAIRSGDYSTDQATLDVYLSGIRSCRQSMIDAGERAGLISANLHSLEIASAAGHGDSSLYAQVKTMKG
jgi:3-hydroxyisobutyrate dehydrogenase-like beta-hydroxyacid dehydrogenase